MEGGQARCASQIVTVGGSSQTKGPGQPQDADRMKAMMRLEPAPTRLPQPPPALRTGDTLVGMMVPRAGVTTRAPSCPPPDRPSATLVGMAVPFAGRGAPPARASRTGASRQPPFLRDEPPPQSGDTVVSLVPPPSIDELLMRLHVEGTETTMPLPPHAADSGPTLELDPVRATESPVDPADTEVAMWLDPDDASVTMVLEPVAASVEEESRERRGQEEPWWLRWTIAAAVLLVLGGTGAWLVQGGEAEEAKATIAVTASSMAARQPSKASTPREPPRAPLQPAAAVVAMRPASHALPAPVGGSPAADERARAAARREAACADARSRAEAGKREREWVAVLEATRRWGCWSSAELRVARARLRVTAFAELGLLERCVAAGSKSRDRKVAARTALCREELEAGVAVDVAIEG